MRMGSTQKKLLGFALGAVAALAPLSALAVGFAPQQSLFLSKNSVTEGDTVVIHTTVNNDGSEAFVGSMKFKDEAGSIGDTAVSLRAGEAGTVSISWQPSAGTHQVTAELDSKTGTVVGTETESFTIDAKPQPIEPATKNTTASIANSIPLTPVDSSKSIQQSIAGISPAAEKLSAPVFGVIDSGRNIAAGALDGGITWSKKQLVQTESAGKKPTAKTALSTSTNAAAGIDQASILKTLWTIVATVALFVLSAFRYLIGNAGMFYPFLLILFFFFLWRLFRGMRRSRY